MVDVILGGQWGDEGKGKLVDILSAKFDLIARATGGANAGHTVYLPDGKKFVFHLIPSGILHEKTICVLGNGMVTHLETLNNEIKVLEENNIPHVGRILLSDRMQLVFDFHKKIDAIQEDRKGKDKVGTTLRGIGPAYTDKIRRTGVRLGEILNFEKFENKVRENLELWQSLYGELEHDIDSELATLKILGEKLRPYIIDTGLFLNNALKEGKSILIEGANGTMLDIDHGTYPFVTSSNASIGGVITGTGIGPKHLGEIIGIMKSYMTRVGGGPFPTELLDAQGEAIREKGGEYGATTGRPRRCGWFDAVATRYSTTLNSMTAVNLTKLDVLSGQETLKIAIDYKLDGKSVHNPPFSMEDLARIEIEYIEMPGWAEDISECRSFDELPQNAQKYVRKIEELIECPVKYIGVGMKRDQMITL